MKRFIFNTPHSYFLKLEVAQPLKEKIKTKWKISIFYDFVLREKKEMNIIKFNNLSRWYE